jgi:hypothetical protein
MSAPGRIKRAVRAGVAVCGGIDGSAATVLRSRSVVGDWNNLEKMVFPSLECALAMDEIAVSRGELPPIVTALARELGGIFVPHIDCEAELNSAPGLVMQLASRLGEVANETAQDIANDGVIDPIEAEAILRKLDAMDRVSAQFRKVVTGIRDA